MRTVASCEPLSCVTVSLNAVGARDPWFAMIKLLKHLKSGGLHSVGTFDFNSNITLIGMEFAVLSRKLTVETGAAAVVSSQLLLFDLLSS